MTGVALRRVTRLATCVALCCVVLFAVGCSRPGAAAPARHTRTGTTTRVARPAPAATLSVDIPSRRLVAGGLATVTVAIANATEATVVVPDVWVSLDTSRGEALSIYSWVQYPRRRHSAVCERCHRRPDDGKPLRAHARLVWPVRFLVPAEPGRYSLVAAPVEGTLAIVTVSFESVASTLSGAAPALGPGERQALGLLAKYHIRSVGSPDRGGGTLTIDDVDDYAVASKAIGLDLKRYLGETVGELDYTLKRRSAHDDTVTVTFFVSGEKVVGAGYWVSGLLGGSPGALNDRSSYTH